MTDVFYEFNGVPTTYLEFALKVNARSRVFSRYTSSVIGLWAHNGPDFIINVFAIWKAGAIPLLLSTRLPEAMIKALLEESRAALLVTAFPIENSSIPRISSDCLDCADQHTGEGPSLPSIGCDDQETVLIAHSSGTTASPKLVRVKKEGLHIVLDYVLNHWNGMWTERDATIGWLPLFHLYAFINELLVCYKRKGRYCFCKPSGREITALIMREGSPVTLLFTVPWMLTTILEMPLGLSALKKLRYVMVSGAVLGHDLGMYLAAEGVRLVQLYGLTEVGTWFMSRVTDNSDWRDLYPVTPQTFWHLEEGSGQLVINSGYPMLSPGGPSLRTGDLFQQTPDGAYRYISRTDDIIVHSNGEKSNAHVIEQIILSCLSSVVHHVLVTGSGRLRPACILQIKKELTAEVRTQIVMAFEHINQTLPGYSRIPKDFILVLAPSASLSLPVTAKNTVRRRDAEALFQQELTTTVL